MNREIKFRGYDYKEEKWYYGSLVLQNYDNYFLLSSTRAIIVDDKLDSRIVDNGTVGQYTGLKDKNGKEIYEGDIINFDSEFGGKETCVVYYDEWKLALNLKNYPTGFIYNGIYNLHNKSNIEVIGNIYEEVK